MKKLSLLNIGQINAQNTKTSVTHHSQEQQKKFSSFDFFGKSPYKSSINKQHLRPNVKEYFPITTRIQESQNLKTPPQSCKASKPISITNALSQMCRDEVKQPDSSRRTSKKQCAYQLKNMLGKDKLSPFDIGQRITTQVVQSTTNAPLSPKTTLKTSPDVRSIYGETSKSKPSIKQKSHNTSERMLQLETTRQKILALQLKIQGNIQQRSQRNIHKTFFPEEKKMSQPVVQQKLPKPPLPQNAISVLQHYNDQLSEYEKKEIIDYETIYFLPQKNLREYNIEGGEEILYNNGFDNSSGDYKFLKQDHIAYRYELVDKLGHGSFGYVFKVHDHKHNQQVALKIIKNKEKFYNQALIEIEILKTVNKADSTCCLIKMLNYFEFRGHICIVFELLSCNLYEFIAINEFTGFDLDLIRRFAIQILQALLFLKEQDIIHCDLKPENVLLKDFNRSGIKVIDFGSSCLTNQKMYTYIQSRFYRAPEIVLGLPYSTQIDMWSFGCIIAELFTGQSLFQSKSEKELLFLQIKVIGKPSKQLLTASTRKTKFFDEKLELIYKINETELISQIKPLAQQLEKASQSFQDFVIKCLAWDPKIRMTPEEALIHPWIVEGLPATIKKQHLQQMRQYRSVYTEGDIDYMAQSQGQGEQVQ